MISINRLGWAKEYDKGIYKKSVPVIVHGFTSETEDGNIFPVAVCETVDGRLFSTPLYKVNLRPLP